MEDNSPVKYYDPTRCEDRSLASLSLTTLIDKIQPLMNKSSDPENFTVQDAEELCTHLQEYKRRGYDMEYFNSGAGAPNNCTIT